MPLAQVQATGETFQELMRVAAEAGQPLAAEQWMNDAWKDTSSQGLLAFSLRNSYEMTISC